MGEHADKAGWFDAKAMAGLLIPAAIATVFNIIAVVVAAKVNLTLRLLAVQPIGTVSEQAAKDGLWDTLPYILLCAFVVFVGLLLFGALLLILLIARGESRWRAAGTVAIAIVNCTLWPIGCRESGRLEYAARTDAFRAVAQRAAPLVAALEQYKLVESTYPPSLDMLVPQYLVAVPDTNLAAYPKYEYEFSSEIKNPRGYSLHVRCPVGGMNWDVFYYAPERDEDNKPHVDRLERIDEWIYVHE